MKIDDWKSILGWDVVPSFGEIHKFEPEIFQQLFYLPANVQEVVDTLKKGLQEGYGISNRHIVGEPGCGKTTFSYYLKKVLSRRSGMSKFSFHILHINRLHTDVYSGKLTPSDDQKEVIDKRVLAILKEFYQENALSSDYDSLVKNEKVRKEQINKLEDYIRDEPQRFERQLILIIDDIDETAEPEVDISLHYLYSLLECHKICKWLIVRETTLDHYSAGLLEFIETKFGTCVPFPRVDLHGIIDKRIRALNPKGINPVTSEVCVRLLQTFNYDLRQAVGGAIHLFEKIDALSSKRSASFIGHYLVKNFTKAMTEAGVFPNIYWNPELKYIPLEKDVFQIICLYNEFPKGYLDKLATYYRNAYKNHQEGRYEAESWVLNFDMRHVDAAIEYLVRQRLVCERGRNAGDYRLTNRGESFAQFVAERLYTTYCKERCDAGNRQRHPMYWVLARRLLSL